MKRMALAAALVGSMAGLSGCLVVQQKEQSINGAYADPHDVRRVMVGRSTTAQVEEAIGTPTSVASNGDGSETWTWNWTKRKGRAGAVFLIAAGSNERTIHESLHVQFRDGVVIRKWRD